MSFELGREGIRYRVSSLSFPCPADRWDSSDMCPARIWASGGGVRLGRGCPRNRGDRFNNGKRRKEPGRCKKDGAIEEIGRRARAKRPFLSYAGGDLSGPTRGKQAGSANRGKEQRQRKTSTPAWNRHFGFWEGGPGRPKSGRNRIQLCHNLPGECIQERAQVGLMFFFLPGRVG